MRHAFIGTDGLIKSAIRMATDVEPWADRVFCNVEDFVAGGGRGEEVRIPIPKPLAGSVEAFKRFTHPLSAERVEEMAAEARANTFILRLIPDAYIGHGRLHAPEITDTAVVKLQEGDLEFGMERAAAAHVRALNRRDAPEALAESVTRAVLRAYFNDPDGFKDLSVALRKRALQAALAELEAKRP